MLEMIERRLLDFFDQPDIYDCSPFSVKDLSECILMQLLKDAYLLTEPEQSLRKHRGTDADDVRMRDSRNVAYAQHYRKLQYEYIKKSTNIEVNELLPKDTETIGGKLEGYNKTSMQYFELNTLADHPLLKAIVSKRICDVKKISNSTFIEYMHDYDELVYSLIEKLNGSDEEVIFSTIALFTLEWKFDIELLYSCVVNAELNGIKDVPCQRLSALCASLNMPNPENPQYTFSSESRFVLHRKKLIEPMYSYSDEEWKNMVEDKICHYLYTKYLIKNNFVDNYSGAEFLAEHTTRKEWADFFRKHYDIRTMYTTKEWTPTRIRSMRSVFNEMFKSQPTPKS